MKLTIIIPTYNEEAVIATTLSGIKKYVKTPHKILVVDDSTDNTEKVVKKYIRSTKNVVFIKNKPQNKGFSRSVKLAVDKIESGALVVMMGDLCDDPKSVDKMYKKILDGWDVVCGSRYIKGGKKTGGPVLQNLLSRFVCLSLAIITKVPTKDVSNAFKMYRRRVFDNIVFNSDSGVESSMETLLQVYFNGGKIVEIPTKWVGREIGISKFNFFQRAPRYLKIYLWAIQNTLRKALGIKLKPFYSK